jgi:serine/threonine protein kinase
VHGEITPTEIRLTPSGQLRLVGFGMAQALREAARRAQSAQRAGDATLSGRLAGATVGRPDYLAPEQLIGASAIVASDLFAIGVVLRECLTGQLPASASTPLTLIGARLGAEQGEARRTEALTGASALADVIAQLTESDAALRVPSALRALEQLR